jgi:hypothetical protein
VLQTEHDQFSMLPNGRWRTSMNQWCGGQQETDVGVDDNKLNPLGERPAESNRRASPEGGSPHEDSVESS